LQETGYKFASDQRLCIYLTNTLEEAIKRSEVMFDNWITDEANAAAKIKKQLPIMVILGNPPYEVSSFNKGRHIEQLLDRYKAAVRNEQNIQPLSDDYIKFIRFAHDRIERTGYGIIGMITNNSYLSGVIHRGMREELLKTFNEIYILNLHGNARMGESSPNGSSDKNIFDIKQGVAISLFIRTREHKEPAKVHYAELWGSRDRKYQYLSDNDVGTTEWRNLEMTARYLFFVPKDLSSGAEYEKWWSINKIFPLNSTCVKTHRDHFVVGFDEESLRKRILEFRDKSITDYEIGERFRLKDTRDWTLKEARLELQGLDDWGNKFNSFLYRPFDIRLIYYSGILLELPRTEVMYHMLKDNRAILTMRGIRTDIYDHIFITNMLTSKDAVSIKDSCYIFPLYRYPIKGEFDIGRHPNIDGKFVQELSDKLTLKFVEEGKGDLQETFGPDDVFNYAYAIFQSPKYREAFSEFLKIDFPRLPLTSNKKLFRALSEMGAELASLHLTESVELDKLITKYPISGSNLVERVLYDEASSRVYVNEQQYFEGITPEVWNFHIGSYRVCEKWLADRKGRQLTYDDIVHYQRVILALKETIRLRADIDNSIHSWPID